MLSEQRDVIRDIIAVLRKHVEVDDININHSFASLGITSLRAVQLVNELNATLGVRLKAHDLFLYPTPLALSNYLTNKSTKLEVSEAIFSSENRQNKNEAIAIIAMDCKYPGADDCESLWDNCISGKECISFFNKKSTKEKNNTQRPVHARGILKDIEYFDAQFFNYSPKEAQLSDPQQRLFIESAWIALEKAGYASDDRSYGRVGVYASMNDSTYILDQSALQIAKDNLTERFALQRLMSSQFLATKVAYLLNCRGPSVTVQTACSSSLVAVVLACQQLASFTCDMAIAGGVSIVTPQDRPYIYQQGNIYSPDGHCRPFDAHAEGTVFSNGLGVVILKRLSDAIRDNDSIISVIKGYSINNDGSHKMSYAAPSQEGQLHCILAAQAMANVEANSIRYVETHGTGTPIGDPIEIDALAKAFRMKTTKEQFCALGSIKANIGHTHVAAGMASLIKTALALQHQQIPPSLHFSSPNPAIDFAHSPFYVNTRLLHWREAQYPRRAAVSAFGVGGTNAHIVLEEAPEIKSFPAKRATYTLLLSAKSEEALRVYHDNLINFLEKQQSASPTLLADLAYTLQIGRNHYDYRSAVVCETLSEALVQLKVEKEKSYSPILKRNVSPKKIVFLFPGQGSQYIDTSRMLYEREPIYRRYLDECLQMASYHMGTNLHDILFPKKENQESAKSKLFQAQFTHPILFSIEYALAKCFQYFGIVPDIMLGHSLGEYVAACLAEVFSLEEAITIVCARGKAIANCGEGEMLAVPLPKKELLPFCTMDIGIAVEITPSLCVVSGSRAAMKEFQQAIEPVLSKKSLSLKPLKNTSPFHTHLLKPAVKPFLEVLQSVKKHSPKIPYLSNLTGDWITDDKLNDQYWVDHMLSTVLLSTCVEKLLVEAENTVFLEVGPGRTLLSTLQMHTKNKLKMITVLANEKTIKKSDDKIFANAIKELWCQGHSIDWRKFYSDEKRRRIPLPTYPFQKQRYWIDQLFNYREADSVEHKTELKFYLPAWINVPEPVGLLLTFSSNPEIRRWIIFANQSVLCEKTCKSLLSMGENIIKIFPGEEIILHTYNTFTINPAEKSHYEEVLRKSVSTDEAHYVILHFWGVDSSEIKSGHNLLNSTELYQGLYSGIFIAQALNRIIPHASIFWGMVTTHLYSVLGNEKINPLKSTVLSLSRVLPLENSNIRMCQIDVDSLMNENTVALYANEVISQVVKNLSCSEVVANTIVLRHQKRWKPTYQEINVTEFSNGSDITIDPQGTYLITGGLGGMGLAIAKWLSDKNSGITILLLSRSVFPAQNSWDDWLANHTPEDPISEKIKQLKKIVRKGCQVEILKGDIADYRQIKVLLSKVEKQTGPIRGIFHLAGISGEGLTALKNIETVQAVLQPKIQGTWVLARLFRKKVLDFFVSASSLTAIAGGVGQIDYCAANIFLDHFLEQNPFKYCERLLTINWNAWRSVGMAANVAGTKVHCRLYAGNSVTPEQGIKVLNTFLRSPYRQVLVSRYQPEEEIKRIKRMFQPEEKIDLSAANRMKPKESNQLNVFDVMGQTWKAVLGVSKINKTDIFYDCGGDSLTMIQLIVALEKHFGITIILQDLIRETSFGGMVRFVEALLQRPDRKSRKIKG
ncbi:SDR family NAD(P)-dependent oxidoreductase [Coxiella burnetii]|uniref:type I polyketide synthase n=1 Tax=Coxiella burnetii TaxID=777 RepID=UPI000FDF86DF|nr:type I polyketide synthase [Coxiella burnetii]AZV75710.1 SDR family NAD(P)-dependent oxidoreductase [Coxiella burnetii]